MKKVWSFFKTTDVINPQYLINDESDQKSVTNKKDATFHFRSAGLFRHFIKIWQ